MSESQGWMLTSKVVELRCVDVQNRKIYGSERIVSMPTIITMMPATVPIGKIRRDPIPTITRNIPNTSLMLYLQPIAACSARSSSAFRFGSTGL